MCDTQLSYAITTDPNPLQANPSGSSSVTASMTLVVSNPSQNTYVTVNKITLTLPVGQNAKNLTNDPASIQSNAPEGWTITQTGGIFEIVPNNTNAGTLGRNGVSFEFHNLIPNDQVGTACVCITEDTGTDSVGETSIPVSKFPPKFSVTDFEATPSVVDPGGSSTLSWNGSEGASYEIKYGSVTAGVGHDGPYVAKDLEYTTVFNLIVTSSEGGQPIETQLQVIVTVNRPQILDFFPDADIVYLGESTGLNWSTSGVESCQLKANGVVLDQNAPVQSPAEGYPVTPSNSTTDYELVAAGHSGSKTREDRNVFAKTLKLQGIVPVAPGSFGVAVDGPTAYVTNPTTSSVEVLDLATGQPTGRIPVGVAPTGIAMNADRSRAYVTNRGDNSISVIDVATNTVTDTLAGIPSPYGIAVIGGTAYVADFDSGGVSIVALASGTITGTLGSDASPTGVAVSPDGSTVYAASYSESKVAVIDVATNSIRTHMEVGGFPVGAAVAANGVSLYVACHGDPDLYVMDTAESSQIAKVPTFAGPLGAGVSANGATVLVTTDLGLSHFLLDL